MNGFLLSPEEVSGEVERIVAFLRTNLGKDEKAVLGLSGGVDSDVTARLAVRAVGVSRLKLFTVVQAAMEDRHLASARALAGAMGAPLAEVQLAAWAPALIAEMVRADPVEGFSNEAFVDVGRAKNSLRTVVYSTYHDRGYVTLGTSNRTEIECGFYVRLGDGIWHLGPIAHLYKTQVYQLAEYIGTARTVIEQPASAGYWPGETDLEDLAYWLVNEAPIGAQRRFVGEEIALAQAIWGELSFERMDRGLVAIADGTTDVVTLAAASGLTEATAGRLVRLVQAARRIKGRPLGLCLDP
jgi:NAD+ synthase